MTKKERQDQNKGQFSRLVEKSVALGSGFYNSFCHFLKFENYKLAASWRNEDGGA